MEQLEAVKSLRRISSYESQYNMIMMMAENVFTVIQSSRARIESSGFIPGVSQFPSDDGTKDALSNILENTALFSEIVLRLPDITVSVLKVNNNWDILLQWSIAFSNQVKYLLDKSTVKLLELVSQELNHRERDANYVNPYRKKGDGGMLGFDEGVEVTRERRRKKKVIKKGPRLHNEL